MFEGLNAQVLGISVDHIPCLQAWAESLGKISFPLLSDFWPHGAISDRYGVLRGSDGFTERAIFVIDRDGVLRYIDIHDIADQPDNEELRNALRQIDLEDEDVAQAAIPVETTMAAHLGVYIEPELEEDALPEGGIIVYCARWCKDCKKAKAWLDERGLQYTEVDVDYHMGARNRVRQWANGHLVTPTFDIDGTVVLDFDIPKLEKALRQWAERKTRS